MTVVIAGPTGVGKSELAVRIAESADGEIVNFDSIQLYRRFDIGSAKPSPEVRARIPHHLFDVLDADQEFNAAEYARAARPIVDDIARRGKLPILVGGTFFYLRALLAGLPEMPARDAVLRTRLRKIVQPRLHRWLSRVDPQSGRSIAPGDRHRVERALEVWLISGRPISSWERPTNDAIAAVKIALSMDRQRLATILDERVEDMYRAGLIEETQSLLERYPESARPFSAIGYREAVAVIHGKMTTEEAMNETRRRTRAYAKRQMTWLRAERNVHWLDATDRDAAFAAALRLIEGES
ncbi:MAG: tRNA (adenosine(37)-N6)-dimethylallyltransferase MiaA [Acidobacteria bacterium]|nr:MAG: tRNA (adenosine(37)-N6)-dimethylallyltransferase MiaA [Acidobacteriota bacterium]